MALGAHLNADTEIAALAVIRIPLTLKQRGEDSEVFKLSAATKHFNQRSSWDSHGVGVGGCSHCSHRQGGTLPSSPAPSPPGALLSDVYSSRGLISPGCNNSAWNQSGPQHRLLLTLRVLGFYSHFRSLLPQKQVWTSILSGLLRGSSEGTQAYQYAYPIYRMYRHTQANAPHKYMAVSHTHMNPACVVTYAITKCMKFTYHINLTHARTHTATQTTYI